MTPGGGSRDRFGEERTDRELMAAHVAGDPDAFSEIVRRHTGRLWAVALRTLRDPEEAADALQDAMVSAFRGAGSYRGDAAVTTWLHRVVVNACLDRTRRARSRPSVPLPDRDLPQRGDDHDSTLTRLDLLDALQRLPEAQRVAIVLVDLQDLSVSTAATVLGVAEGTVKSRCARGRAALAEILRPDDDLAPAPLPGNPGAPGRVPPLQVRRSTDPVVDRQAIDHPVSTTPTEETPA